MKTENIYMPLKAAIRSVKQLSKDVKLFNLDIPGDLLYQSGQFLMVSAWGAGEVPISIASMPGSGNGLELCIRIAGHVTSAINRLDEGDTIWVRGPYGKPFPFNRNTSEILVVCGGIGVVPLRPLIHQIMADNAVSRNLNIIYGSKSPEEILFADEVELWSKSGANVIMTVDACDMKTWKGCTGLVTEHLGKTRLNFKNCTAYICGPPVMIQASMRDLSLRGMPDDRIITTLEAHMKCGVGKCGHCFCGGKLICEEGPVFTFEEIKRLRIRPGIDGLD